MKAPKTQRDMDIALIELLRKHKGRANCISSKSICEILNNNGYATKPTSLYPNIHRVMYEYNLPICYVSMKGYYIAESEEDILPVVEDLQTRINGLQKHVEFLQQFRNR